MYEHRDRRRRATAPARACGGSSGPAGGRADRGSLVGAGGLEGGAVGLVAAEERPGYSVAPAAPAGPVVDRGPLPDAAAGHEAAAPRRPAIDAAVNDGRTRGERARAALARLAATPDWSPLTHAVAELAEGVAALAAVEPGEEHEQDLADAVLALCHLRARLEAGLLEVLRGFDRRAAWREDGAASATSWLRWRTTCDYGTASGLVQTARRLGDLPQLAGLLADGDISLAHATAITRAAVPGRRAAVAECEPILAELARTNPPQDVRRALRHLAAAADDDGSVPEDDGPPGDPLRELHLRTGFQGHGNLEGTLDPLTREALQVLVDAFHTPDPADTPPRQRRSAAQCRHDAFAALLHTLLDQPGLPSVQGARPQILITIDLAALLGLPEAHPLAGVSLADLADAAGIDLTDLGLALDGDSGDPTSADAEPDRPTADTPHSDGDGGGPPDGDTPGADAPHADTDQSGPGRSGAEQPSTDGQGAAEAGVAASPGSAGRTGVDGRPAARSAPRRVARFGSGVAVDPALVRGLLPAATIMAVLTLGPWRVANVGRKHRTLPGWLRALLVMLHRHCRGPGCDRPGNWTEAHHLTDWIAGGDTDVNDSLPVCGTHHDYTTNRGWKVTLDHTTGEAIWTSPKGRTLRIAAPPP